MLRAESFKFTTVVWDKRQFILSDLGTTVNKEKKKKKKKNEHKWVKKAKSKNERGRRYIHIHRTTYKPNQEGKETGSAY